MSIPSDCCSPCPSVTAVNVPGVPGANGNNGINAFTTTLGVITLPIPLANVGPIAVANSSWLTPGQSVVASSDASHVGTFRVVSVSTGFVTLQWLAATGDSAQATPIPIGATLSPSGAPGLSSFGVLAVTCFATAGAFAFTPNPNATALYVECIGAGGSGGGGGSTAGDASLGSGGGGGAYSAVFLTPILATYSGIVGAGGAAPAPGNNPGILGGFTSFIGNASNLCLANGGAAGAGGGAPGTTALLILGGTGASVAGAVGDLVMDGDDGGISNRVSGTVGSSGRGGSGPFSGGSSSLIAQGNGNTGGQYGGGGSGGNTLNGGAATSGGAGADGLVRIWQLG
jgi:hypothetical protein